MIKKDNSSYFYCYAKGHIMKHRGCNQASTSNFVLGFMERYTMKGKKQLEKYNHTHQLFRMLLHGVVTVGELKG